MIAKYISTSLILFTIISLTACNRIGAEGVAATLTPVPTATVPPTAITDMDTITLIFPTFEDNNQDYYIELTQKALEATGHHVNIETTGIIPQTRAIQMLEDNEVSILWLIQSAERDEQYTPVKVGLTNGLIGHRIFLIPSGEEDAYMNVTNLDDFRSLGKVGAFGKEWFDAKVWAYNDLSYVGIEGEWRVIYDMLAAGNRSIDYFSRGFTEIAVDAAAHPELAIESQLIFIYDRDFRFYLSASAAPYKDVLEEALTQAAASGLTDELIRQYWATDLETLNFDNRVKIVLDTP